MKNAYKQWEKNKIKKIYFVFTSLASKLIISQIDIISICVICTAVTFLLTLKSVYLQKLNTILNLTHERATTQSKQPLKSPYTAVSLALVRFLKLQNIDGAATDSPPADGITLRYNRWPSHNSAHSLLNEHCRSEYYVVIATMYYYSLYVIERMHWAYAKLSAHMTDLFPTLDSTKLSQSLLIELFMKTGAGTRKNGNEEC